MQQRAYIETVEEFNYCVGRGHNPLLDVVHFQLEPNLRRHVQDAIFGQARNGKRGIPEANEAFYRYMWEARPHQCEECLKPLGGYSAVFISHILTRGAHPEMAHDPRNVNILCFDHHNQWENGNRQAMRIYRRNLKTIEELKEDYR